MTHDRPGNEPGTEPAVHPEEAPAVSKEAAEPQEPPHLSGREMLDQLEVMVRQIAADTPPALKQSAASLAEWTAMAARSTGPLARRLAEIAGDASLRLAERSQRLAEDLRAEAAAQEPAETHQGDSDGAGPAEPSDR